MALIRRKDGIRLLLLRKRLRRRFKRLGAFNESGRRVHRSAVSRETLCAPCPANSDGQIKAASYHCGRQLSKRAWRSCSWRSQSNGRTVRAHGKPHVPIGHRPWNKTRAPWPRRRTVPLEWRCGHQQGAYKKGHSGERGPKVILCLSTGCHEEVCTDWPGFAEISKYKVTCSFEMTYLRRAGPNLELVSMPR